MLSSAQTCGPARMGSHQLTDGRTASGGAGGVTRWRVAWGRGHEDGGGPTGAAGLGRP